MTGVEILATEQVAVTFGFDWGSFIGCGILCGIVLALGFWGISTTYSFNLGGIIAIIIIGFLLGMGVGVGWVLPMMARPLRMKHIIKC